MTPQSTAAAAGLSPAALAHEPAWVRHGSTRVQQDYQVAVGFEEMLLEQLSSSVSGSGEGEASGEEGSQSGLGGSMNSSLLPQALSQGVLAGGGLGLAAQLTRQMEGVGGSAGHRVTGSGGASS